LDGESFGWAMYDQAMVLFETLSLQNYAWSQPHQDRHQQPRTGTGNRRAPASSDSLQDACTTIVRQRAGWRARATAFELLGLNASQPNVNVGARSSLTAAPTPRRAYNL